MSNEGKCSTPFLHPESRLKTTPATIAALLGLVATVVAAWVWAMADIRAGERTDTTQDKRIEALEAVQRTQTELLWEIRGDVKALRTERRTNE